MAYQKKITTSYGSRLKGSLGGIKTGAIMFVLGTILLFLNEGNYVKTNKSIREAGSALVSVGGDISAVDQSLNGKLIYAYGLADTQDVLTDGLFGISASAIRISRKAEYYQYRENTHTEKKDKLGGGEETTITYTYEKTWASSPINSNAFEDPDYKKSNFVLMNVESKTEQAANVSFGAYKLPPVIISSISANVPANVDMSDAELQQWENQIAKNMDALGRKKDGQLVNVQGNVVYFGKSASTPAIGDVRVTLTKTMPADISIIAKVVGSTFDKFIASNGREFLSVSMGIVGADTLIARAKSENSLVTWVLRFFGVFLVVVGLKSMFSILPTLFKVLPFLGTIIGAGVGLVCTVGGGAWSLVIISLAWLFYRPLIAIPMLLAVVAGIWFLRKKAKEKKAAAGTAGTTAETGTSNASADGWTCACGTVNKGKFCASCGKPQPETAVTTPETSTSNASADGWTCACGTVNKGKFCASCGKPQPLPDGWTCACGTVNKGKFCANCGKPQP